MTFRKDLQTASPPEPLQVCSCECLGFTVMPLAVKAHKGDCCALSSSEGSSTPLTQAECSVCRCALKTFFLRLCWYPCGAKFDNGENAAKKRKLLPSSHPDLSVRFVKETSLTKKELMADIGLSMFILCVNVDLHSSSSPLDSFCHWGRS